MTRPSLLHTFIIVTVVAAIFRLVIFGIAVQSDGSHIHQTSFFMTNPDSNMYDRLAVNIWHQGVYSEATAAPWEPAAERGPGYPAFLAAVYTAVGHRVGAAIMCQIVLASILAGAVGVAGYKVGGHWAGLAGGLMQALDLASGIYANLLLTESTTACLVFATTLALVLSWRSGCRHSLLGAYVAGALAGLTAYVRTAALLWVLPLLISNVLHRFRSRRKTLLTSMLLVLGMVSAVTPWVLRNYVVFGQPGFSSGLGTALYMFNAPQVVAAADGGMDFDQAQAALWHAVAGQIGGDADAQFQDSGVLTGAALKVMSNHKLTVVKQFALASARTLVGPSRGFFIRLVAGTYPWARDLWLLFLGIWLLVLLAAGRGIVLMASREKLRALACLIVLSVIYYNGVAFLQGYSRFRLPYVPLLCVAAGVGASSLMKEKRRRALGDPRGRGR